MARVVLVVAAALALLKCASAQPLICLNGDPCASSPCWPGQVSKC